MRITNFSWIVLMVLVFGWQNPRHVQQPPQQNDEQAFLEAAIKPDMDPATAARVQKLLDAVIVENRFTAPPPNRPLHVLEYNAEQGLGFADMVLLMSDPDKFLKEKIPDAGEAAIEQVTRASRSDIILMSELDIGVCRSGHRDVPKELSQALKMNYAYVTEFLELEPKDLGEQKNKHSCKDVDYSRTQNLTGNAIMSRFPLENVRRLPLENCYDWYEHEMNPPFYKKISHWPRQLRRGQRAAVMADVRVGGDFGVVTVVSAHLEVNSQSSCRATQMEQILNAVRGVKNPAIIAGDLNTIHIRGSEAKLFKEWKNEGFDLSGNDGKGTDMNQFLASLQIRLDWIGVRGLRVTDGETLTELGEHGIKISDHLPIAADLN
jgi:endonuclease/exonuclease/phosphatase family metal-dependent hydrolase